MKKFGYLILLILCYAVPVVAIDYDNDGFNDVYPNGSQDDYRPYFMRHDMATVNIYIDFNQMTPFFTMTLNNGVMTPISQGTVNVQIATDQLIQSGSLLAQNIASGSLKLEIAEIPGNTVIKGEPVTIYDNSEVSLPFTIAYLTPDMANLPLTLNLYNDNDGCNMHLISSDINLFQQTDDRPFGQQLSLNSFMTIGDTDIVQGDTVQIQGWAFDDNEGMAVSIIFQRDEFDNDNIALAEVIKSVHSINDTIPYWGASYPSGFQIDWNTEDRRGNYLLTTRLNDGSHEVDLETKKIFWNKKPEIEINTPAPYENIYTMDYLLTGEAVDLDVNVDIGAFLSSVEIYIDDESNMIGLLTHNDLANEDIVININWSPLSDYDQGEHVLYAVARDSFGLVSDELAVPIVIFNAAPSIINVSPRLGPWEGNNIVSITGNGLAGLSNVSFQNIPASILPGATDSLVQVIVNSFVPPESRYTELRVSNDYGSYFKQDAYRFIPAKLNPFDNDSQFADIKYRNLDNTLYVLNSSDHTVDVYEQDDVNDLDLTYSSSFATSGNAVEAELKMELSRLEDIMFLIYDSSNRIELYDLENEGSVLDTIYITDGGGSPVAVNSSAYLISDEYLMTGSLIVGTQGPNAGLYLIHLDLNSFNHTVEEITLPGNYDIITVYSSSNKSTAYILFKDSGSGDCLVYRYDARYDLFSDSLPCSLSLSLPEINELKLAVNYNGAEFMLYTSSQILRFDKYGVLLDSASYGMDLALYDSCRSILYTLNDGESAVNIRSVENLNEEITFCDLPDNSQSTASASLDWNGEFIFALAHQGTAVVKVNDIYPEIVDLPTFIQTGQTVQFKVNNKGQVPENVATYVDKIEKETTYDNDNNTYTLTYPLDNDSLEKLAAKLYGYPSKEKSIYMMTKLADIVDNAAGLPYFYPAGLFYDEIRSDLYAFDPSQTGGFTMARFHIDIDNEGEITVTRKMIPFQMYVGNPISMAVVNDYIVVLSLYSNQCSWFNVVDFDLTASQTVNTANISPYITPSGIVGYSPVNQPGINYLYLWNSLSTGGPGGLFQINLDTGMVGVCFQITSPHITDVYIDYDSSDHTKDKAYAVSSFGQDIINVFEPFKVFSNISSFTEINLGSASGAYKIVSNDEHFFVSLYDSKGITLFDPDLSGGANHFVYNILNNDSKYSRFLTADNNNIVFSGKEADNSFTLSFMDINSWDDYPYAVPFNISENYTVSSYQIYDVKSIKGKVFTIIGHDIYIINLINKEED